MAPPRQETSFALCIANKGYDDLDLPDDTAAQEGYLRVVDESMEDYLYPESHFVLLELPGKAQEALSSQS